VTVMPGILSSPAMPSLMSLSALSRLSSNLSPILIRSTFRVALSQCYRKTP
jgi:hypothetical protein